MTRGVFVAGTGTGVGKTLVSAVLTEALDAEYWKPVQSGTCEITDRQTVSELVSAGRTPHPEVYSFRAPLSPHAAAALERREIVLERIVAPQSRRPLVVEGAGGLLVPLSSRWLIADLIAHLNLPIVLVVRHYLGSINHTLLSLEAIRVRKLPLCGVIYSGDENQASEEAIQSHGGGVTVLGRINEEPSVTPEVITRYTGQFRGLLS